MRRSMRKCREMEQLTVMGVRTRAMTSALASERKRRKEASSTVTAEYKIAYLELRNRKLMMRTRTSRSSGSTSLCLTADHGNLSSEVAVDSESAVCYFQSRTERSRSDEPYDLESTAGRRAAPERPMAAMTPSEAEIEEFFAAAELKESQRFAKTYNFDVVNDVPLEGRYEWLAVAP